MQLSAHNFLILYKTLANACAQQPRNDFLLGCLLATFHSQFNWAFLASEFHRRIITVFGLTLQFTASMNLAVHNTAVYLIFLLALFFTHFLLTVTSRSFTGAALSLFLFFNILDCVTVSTKTLFCGSANNFASKSLFSLSKRTSENT